MTHYIVKPISVSVKSPNKLEVDIANKQQLVVEFKNIIINNGEHYRGPYTATPSWVAQTLATNHKLMMSDVTINAIPYTEQENIGYIAPAATQTVTKTLKKVVAGNQVLMDLTQDTIEPQYLKQGLTAHGANGSQITGTASVTYIAQTKELIVPSWALEVE